MHLFAKVQEHMVVSCFWDQHSLHELRPSNPMLGLSNGLQHHRITIVVAVGTLCLEY